MENNNVEVLKKIKEEFLLSKPARNRSLRIPSSVSFYLEGNSAKIELSRDIVCSNMQKDDGAFEGWALVLKRWGKYDKIILSWVKPEDGEIANGHYQRFLFRIQQFEKDFNMWFSIDIKCLLFLEDLKIKEQENYLLNMPGKRRNEVKGTPEAKLENCFVHGELRKPLEYITDAVELDR